MALVEIHYEGMERPLVVDDVDYGCAIGIRRTNEFGNAIDSWHSLIGAVKLKLVLAPGETLAPR